VEEVQEYKAEQLPYKMEVLAAEEDLGHTIMLPVDLEIESQALTLQHHHKEVMVVTDRIVLEEEAAALLVPVQQPVDLLVVLVEMDRHHL
jgi:hypothetical protein